MKQGKRRRWWSYRRRWRSRTEGEGESDIPEGGGGGGSRGKPKRERGERSRLEGEEKEKRKKHAFGVRRTEWIAHVSKTDKEAESNRISESMRTDYDKNSPSSPILFTLLAKSSLEINSSGKLYETR
ncbi:hypothetical protein ANTQUA_LOCUS5660 [Anthophora quadrimaculata]